MGLVQEATTHLDAFVEHSAAGPLDFLRAAEQFRKLGALEEASLFLQAGRFKIYDEDLWKAAAVVALELERWAEAAEILQVLTLNNSAYA